MTSDRGRPVRWSRHAGAPTGGAYGIEFRTFATCALRLAPQEMLVSGADDRLLPHARTRRCRKLNRLAGLDRFKRSFTDSVPANTNDVRR